ncbi:MULTISPECIES: hypothetical protein [Streptosporangium]|uniref:Uncharacterized protein n=1 Tax=Streptosporangium brasiliense TaxID=47480 RepID=A0ABT9RP13_9ACTN|nr:hypothetical protein [Streptosporangium brasiliense]MDP9870454.1 hypothetical protein [Streptosporangium brasiliense]
MIQILQVGVAAWMVYEAIRAVTAVVAALQPLLVIAVCYGLTFAPPVALLALNAAAVVAAVRLLFARLAVPERIQTAPSPSLLERLRASRPAKPSRIPDLP